MSIKNTAVSSILTLMFVSLLVIYLNTTSTMLITFLSVLIMLVGLIMAQSSNWRDIGILAAVSVIVSMVAIALLASARLGQVGTVIALVLWALILFALFSSFRQTYIPLPHQRAILIRNIFTDQVYRADAPIVGESLSFMERVVAVIPLYELNSDVRVEKLNTKRQPVDAVDVHVRYRVTNPIRSFLDIPNHAQALDEVAKEVKQSLDDARRNEIFWEKLLDRQMKIDTDEVVLKVIFDNRFAQNPLEVAASREDLDETILDQLRPFVSRWGVEVLDLRIERVEFNPEVARSINKAGLREDETLLRRIEAERDATRIREVLGAEAEAEGERIKAIVAALKDSGVEITPDLLVKTITAMSDWQMEGDFSLLTQNPITPPPGGGAAPAKPPEKK